MLFGEVEGHKELKQKLIKQAGEGRVAHAQLLYGPEGNGALPLAISYAQYLSCQSPGPEDSCGNCISCKQFRSYNYPDLHFVYPVVNISKSPGNPTTSKDKLKEWIGLLQESKYFGLYRWMEELGAEKKQPGINVKESSEILHELSLKSYSGGYKFLILWLPERLNPAAANKLLKILEEPPVKTVFLLVSEKPENILQTISSRCQKIFVPAYSTSETSKFLAKHEEIDPHTAEVIGRISNGNLAQAIRLVKRSEAYQDYAVDFRDWVRGCYKADLNIIFPWVEKLSQLDRERLRDFLMFCSSSIGESFKMNFIKNEVPNEVFRQIEFELSNFAPFVHLGNSDRILKELDSAAYDIGRNAHPKILLTDLSLKLARLLRVKH